MRSKILLCVIATSLLLNGFLAYKLISTTNRQAFAQKTFPFLSKRIFAENQNDILINFIPLRASLNEYVRQQGGKVGVYFEYLPSGTSIGVNDKEEVKIASLSKVPMVMSIFKKIERKKMFLNDELVVEKKHLNQKFGSLWQRGENTKISVEDLIKLTLTESDNTAYNVLFDQLTEKELGEVYDRLDLALHQKEENGEIYLLISPKNYSSIFRSLYLSSFLQEENSNSVLKILTKTAFNNKIVAGIPENVEVSHKIGVFEKEGADLYTDCGIVYAPQRPYILCVFVQDTETKAQKHMSYISRMIYEYIKVVKTE